MNYPGIPIKRGFIGDAVKQIQAELGCEPDGVFGPLTQKAVMRFQATHSDQYGIPLVVDGIVGPITWSALFGFPKPEPVTNLSALAVIKTAESQLGVKEEPVNRGREVTAYLNSVGLTTGQPWCMSFVYWCFAETYKAMNKTCPAPKTGACYIAYQWAKKNHKLAERPKPGDIMLIRGGPRGHQHAGIVTAVNGGYIDTIEGNTNKAGASEGLYVMRRTRKINACDFVRVL